MQEFQDTIIKISFRNFIALIIGVISIVSSFWVGYGNVMDKLNSIEQKQVVRDYEQDNEIYANKAEIIRIKDKITQLETK